MILCDNFAHIFPIGLTSDKNAYDQKLSPIIFRMLQEIWSGIV